jgi:hypothetical protein
VAHIHALLPVAEHHHHRVSVLQPHSANVNIRVELGNLIAIGDIDHEVLVQFHDAPHFSSVNVDLDDVEVRVDQEVRPLRLNLHVVWLAKPITCFILS